MILRDVSLRHLNTFGLDVRAAQYAEFRNGVQLGEILGQVEYQPWILGGGSNVLFLEDISRCVLKNAIDGIVLMEDEAEHVLVRAGGGVVWHDLVMWCISHDYGGIENLALIPGTVGAAPMQNIGAYGVELKETFVALRAMRLKDRSIHEFDADECEFGYRNSVLKNALKDQYAILDVDLRLTKPPHNMNISYGAIRDILTNKAITTPTIGDVSLAVMEIRRGKLPDPAFLGNAGSFFKNPTVSTEKYQDLIATNPGMPSHLIEQVLYKIPAGWLIEQCGWKGKHVGNVGCYEKQALVIVNYGGASGREIYDHALRVRESVHDRFGIKLSMEVNVIGKDMGY